MKRKLFAIITVCALAVSLASCTGSGRNVPARVNTNRNNAPHTTSDNNHSGQRSPGGSTHGNDGLNPGADNFRSGPDGNRRAFTGGSRSATGRYGNEGAYRTDNEGFRVNTGGHGTNGIQRGGTNNHRAGGPVIGPGNGITRNGDSRADIVYRNHYGVDHGASTGAAGNITDNNRNQPRTGPRANLRPDGQGAPRTSSSRTFPRASRLPAIKLPAAVR